MLERSKVFLSGNLEAVGAHLAPAHRVVSEVPRNLSVSKHKRTETPKLRMVAPYGGRQRAFSTSGVTAPFQ